MVVRSAKKKENGGSRRSAKIAKTAKILMTSSTGTAAMKEHLSGAVRKLIGAVFGELWTGYFPSHATIGPQ